MKEYKKNRNEYREDGRLHIERIGECICQRRQGEKYVVTCRIIQRGVHEYFFEKGSRRIYRPNSQDGLFLSEEALNRVTEAVSAMDGKIAEVRDGGFKRIRLNDLKSTLYYRSTGDYAYDVMIKTKMPDKKADISVFESISAGRLVHEIYSKTIFRDDIDRKKAEIILRSGVDSLINNQLYMGAIENKDELLQKQLRLHYGIASEEDCRSLEKIFGIRILPSLPEEYDRYYVVDSTTVNPWLLASSGYQILHRPGFAMKGSTREKWQLNPHTKSGVDAARNEQEAVTFREFLGMFEGTDV